MAPVRVQPVRVVRVVVSQWQRRSRQGQVTMEYFIIAAMLAGLSLVGISPFAALIKNSIEGLINVAAKRFASS